MKKMLYVLLLIFVLSSCGKSDIDELGISEGEILNDNKGYELIEKDKVRLNDLTLINSAIQGYYYENYEYPSKDNLKNILGNGYIDKFPKDIILHDNIEGCEFGYIYEIGDNAGILNQNYKLSSCLESKDNIEKRAMLDGGTDNKRIEFGNDLSNTEYKEKFFINDIVSESINSIKTDVSNKGVNNTEEEIEESFIKKYYTELGKGNLEYVYSITSWEMGQKEYSTFFSWYNGIERVEVENIAKEGNGEFIITVVLYYTGKSDGERITTKKRVVTVNDNMVLQTIKTK